MGSVAFAVAPATGRSDPWRLKSHNSAPLCPRSVACPRPRTLLVASLHPTEPKPEELFFATCARGLGNVLATEIEAPQVGGKVSEAHASGVQFRGASVATGYAACLWLRTAIRVLHTLALSTDIYETDRFASDYDAMYAFIQGAADWTQLLPHSSCTFSILVRESPGDTRRSGPPQERRHGRGRVAGPPAVQIFGSQRAQLCAKNAICDALRDAGLDKPARPVNHAGAYLPLLLSIHGGQVTLYRDMAGASLHKRGYRSDSALHRSSLNEAVASGMLLLAGFGVDGSFRAQQKGNPGLSGGASAGLEQASGGGPPKKSLVVCDPMCGSGTLLIEAALIRLHVAPGLYRESFPFQDWSDFDQGAWDELVDAAVSSQRRDEDINMELIGNDAEPAALALAERDLRRTNLSHAVRLVHGSAAELQLDKQVTLVVSNPPWGRRLEGEDEAWYALGSFLRNNARAGSAMLLSGDPALTRGIRMRAREKYPIRVGDVDCRALAYDVLPAKKS